MEDLDRGTRDGPQSLILMSPSSRSMKVVTVYTTPLEGEVVPLDAISYGLGTS